MSHVERSIRRQEQKQHRNPLQEQKRNDLFSNRAAQLGKEEISTFARATSGLKSRKRALWVSRCTIMVGASSNTRGARERSNGSRLECLHGNTIDWNCTRSGNLPCGVDGLFRRVLSEIQ
ncbi:hypothetical protein NPIL_49751 [Nephila pilipes]|uniref:Uncharacterized protein n=1 Tax=Nephila pilipes TaxID=299642 RepID=A0A8X6N1P6_NEPPI|nr:hypothetical protein NPIL_49751 [Nephila pilipes]